MLLITGACSTSQSGSNEGTPAPPTPAARTANESARTSGTPARAVTEKIPEVPPGVLEPKYYQDSDGNAIPDFMEVEMGKDPLKDDCVTEECGEAAEGLDFLERPHNTLLMLDSSGSMRASAGGGQTKMEAAKKALASYVQPLPENFKLGFLAYGHKGDNTESGKAESCRGIDVFGPIGTVTPESISGVLDKFQPTGWTPIAASFDRAAEAFAGMDGQDNRAIMISDGLETCGGDPVAAARRLHEQGIRARIDVVGFGVESADAAQLRAIAEAGGGEYFDARTSRDLFNYLTRQNEAYHKTLDAFLCLLRNVRKFTNCGQIMTNQATAFRLSKLIDQARASGRADEVEAYRALSRRISELFREKYREVEQFQSRIPGIKEKLDKISEQRQRAVKSQRGG